MSARRRAWFMLAAGLSASSIAADDPPFESELARLAGRSARQCGIFRWQPERKPGQDVHAGWACVLEAERAG